MTCKNTKAEFYLPGECLTDPHFSRLAASISLLFAGSGPTQIDAAINKSLARCAEYFKADRAYVFLFNDQQHTMSNTYEYCAAGIEPQRQTVQEAPLSAFPWFCRKILMQEPVAISSVAGLPTEAGAEKAEFSRQSIQSLLCQPLLTGDHPLGFWGVDMVRSQVCWSHEQVVQAALLGEIIAWPLRCQRTQRALDLSRGRLENAQRIAHLGGWEWEIAENLLFWSDEVYLIFGLKPQEFAASYEAFLACVHPEDRAMVEQAVQAALKDGKAYEIEHRIRRPEGEMRWVLERAEVVRDQAGNPLRMTGTVQDITERKSLENRLMQSQKMQAIGVMASGIAHDFNNILTPIMIYSQMLLQEAPTGSLSQKNLTEVLKAAERARSLVRQILDLSRDGKHAPQPIRLGPMLKEVVKFLRPSIPQTTRLTCRIETEHDLMMADPTQMFQVVMNLLINAAHAMGEQHGAIIISLDSMAAACLPILPTISKAGQPRSCLRLMVSDTGKGIPAALLNRIFEPYFTTKNKGEGTGLGLAVVHGIVEKHGGCISVVSEPGQGTTFEVLLPGGEKIPENKAAPAGKPVKRAKRK